MEMECEICERKIFDAVVDSHIVNADRKYILCTECFMKWLEKFHREGLSASMDDVNAWRTKFIRVFKQNGLMYVAGVERKPDIGF